MTSLAGRVALLLLVGCGGRTASSAQATIDGEAGHAEGGGGPTTSSAPDASLPGEATADATSSEDASADVRDAAAPGLTQGPTVWIGQTDMNVTYPPGYDGGPTVSADDPVVTSPEKVVLILNAAVNPLVGTITFGDDSPPPPATDPTQPYPPEPTTVVESGGQTVPFGPINTNLVDTPFPGFSYSLVSSSLSGSLLDLAFVPSELFQSYCVLRKSPPNLTGILQGQSLCICDGGACSASTSPVRRFELTVSGNTMQGQLSFPNAGFLVGTTDIRLQRVE